MVKLSCRAASTSSLIWLQVVNQSCTLLSVLRIHHRSEGCVKTLCCSCLSLGHADVTRDVRLFSDTAIALAAPVTSIAAVSIAINAVQGIGCPTINAEVGVANDAVPVTSFQSVLQSP